MEIVSNIALISINETLILQIISFLIFLYIINRIMFRPLQNIMAERNAHIEKIKTDIIQAQKRVDNITIEIGNQEAAVKKEAYKFKATLEEDGNRQATEIFASVRVEIAEANQEAKKDIEVKLSEARENIQKESETLAVDIIERILERRLGA